MAAPLLGGMFSAPFSREEGDGSSRTCCIACIPFMVCLEAAAALLRVFIPMPPPAAAPAPLRLLLPGAFGTYCKMKRRKRSVRQKSKHQDRLRKEGMET